MLPGRLPTCEEDDEDEDGDDQHPQPPPLSAVAGVEELPDVVPLPAPRTAPRPEPRAPPPKWRATSAFTKYLTGDAAAGSAASAPSSVPAEATEEAFSETTLCYRLPDLVCDAVGHAPCPAPGAALDAAPWPAPCAAQSTAPNGPWAYPPEPAPRRRRRPHKASKGATPALASEWLRQREDELEKTLSKMPGVGASAPVGVPVGVPSDWVRVGEDLRMIADHFSHTLPVSTRQRNFAHNRGFFKTIKYLFSGKCMPLYQVIAIAFDSRRSPNC